MDDNLGLTPSSTNANANFTGTDSAAKTMKDLGERVKVTNKLMSSPFSSLMISPTFPTLAASTSTSTLASNSPLSLSLATAPLVSSLSSKSLEHICKVTGTSSNNNSDNGTSSANASQTSTSNSSTSKVKLRTAETLKTTFESTLESPAAEEDMKVKQMQTNKEQKGEEAVKGEKSVPQKTPETKLILPNKKKGFKQIKLTILDLTGIKVNTVMGGNCHSHYSNRHRHSQQQYQQHQQHNQYHQPLHSNFAISAMISFSGSCDPQDMCVVSSRLCSISERLVVESKPVVVPYGMTDSLIAVWSDDEMNESTYKLTRNSNRHSTSTTSSDSKNSNHPSNHDHDHPELGSSSIPPPPEQLQCSLSSCSSRSSTKSSSKNPDQGSCFVSSKHSSVYGKEKGSILLPETQSVLPHLFVSIQDKSSSCSISPNLSVSGYHDPNYSLLNDALDEDEDDDYDDDFHDNDTENCINHNSNHSSNQSNIQNNLYHPSITSSALSSSLHSTTATGHSNAPELDSTDTSSSNNRSNNFESNITQFVHQKKAFLGQGRNGDVGKKTLKASTVTAPRSFRTVTDVHHTSLPEESPVHLPVTGNINQQQANNQMSDNNRIHSNPPIREVYDKNKIKENQDFYNC